MGSRRVAIAAVVLATASAGAATRLCAEDVPSIAEALAESRSEALPVAPSPPPPLLHPAVFESRGFTTSGWIDAGIGANEWGSPFNGPVVMADRSWQGQVNQVCLVTERIADTGGEGWAWGGRADLLFGTDTIYTTARGLDAFLYPRDAIENVASWATSKDYGFALPQLYADVARDDLNLRLGHFYSITGYETVPATGNFFYTHAYSMMYQPFTFTGALACWKPDDRLTVYAGIHDGWNNFCDAAPMTGPWAIRNRSYPGASSTAAFLGGVVFTSDDGRRSLASIVTSGNELSPLGPQPADGSLVGNRTLVSTVYSDKVTDRLEYVAQVDTAWQFNSALPPGNLGQQPGLAQWYSFVNWIFWTFDEHWKGGFRIEYFRDNNGYLFYLPYRNVAQADNPGYYTGGFAGNFWDVSFGLNYRPSPRWVFRPEVRYDWFTPNTGVTARPFGRGLGQGIGTSGDRLGQFYGGCDVVYRY